MQKGGDLLSVEKKIKILFVAFESCAVRASLNFKMKEN
jgi:hypothetical protein